MLALEERLGVHIEWVGAVHADHAPHLHAHLIAVVPKRLYTRDFQALRQRATEASLEQREFLDLVRGHQQERPYPAPALLRSHKGTDSVTPRYPTRLKYPALGASRYARKQARAHQTAFQHSSRGRPRVHRGRPYSEYIACVCPRCKAVSIHARGDPAHRCACGMSLHTQKALTLTRERGRERERML
jgi:hypothetical protein